VKRLWTEVVVLLTLILLLTACNQSKTTSKDFDGDDTANANVKTGIKPEADSQVAVIETADYGRIVVELYPNIAPKMVEQFKKLINDHDYDGTAIQFSDIPYERGTLGAARTNDVNGANCQWFITLKRQPAFDRKYTVFGKVIDGIKNAEIIMTAPTETGSERPADKVVIKSATLQPRASFQ